MELKLMHSVDELVEHVFKGNENGYDALEVDTYLDGIVQDYYAMNEYYEKSDARIKELEKENKSLKEAKDKFEVENTILNEKVKISSSSDGSSANNLDLLKRISALEGALYKAGIDPSKI